MIKYNREVNDLKTILKKEGRERKRVLYMRKNVGSSKKEKTST